MRVMVLVKATQESETGRFDPRWAQAMMAEMGRFNDELRDAGVLVMAEWLLSSNHGKRVVFDSAGRAILDGPFMPSEELVAGFWLWEVRDMDEALDWVARCPNPMPGRSVIEVRPLHERG